ncbi:NAD(P)-dependent oxidoreductase [Paraneptunicella aestuarii]|uniref:NAD-dependent epimerase/dehydratase family protein n=1 Tax=Paraneptunicella aestuarii TaxID=2831148 RepID=UPI001E403B49|nr:NAD(P)-dependent oxidoreductase [Paraneptunicella aestuarii]UAA37500.1 NAD(P)-dependent oxidoreductase [Paraneptunicella aestuarii]
MVKSALHKKVAITGANGFIGSTALKKLKAHGLNVRPIFHNQLPDDATDYDYICCDISNNASINGVFNDIDTILHLANYVGNDESLAQKVNVQGSQNIVEEARRAGVRRIIYVSNASVYEGPTHKGIKESEVACKPESLTSITKLQAEHTILEFEESAILRPLFIYGTGDKWFIPSIATFCKAGLPPINEGKALLSVISIDTLADYLLRLIQCPDSTDGIFHVSEPPVELKKVIQYCENKLALEGSNSTIDLESAYEKLTKYGVRKHQLELIASDHYYNCDRINNLLQWAPENTFDSAIDKYSNWYEKVFAN